MMLSCYLQSLTVYEIKTEDVYKDVFEAKSLFDFGDCPRDSKFFDPVNIKLLLK